MGKRLDIRMAQGRGRRGADLGAAPMRRGFFVALTGLCLSLPVPAASFDRVNFTLNGSKDDTILSAIQGASILASLEGADDTTTQDLLAAAQSDYTRVVEALYAQGYYSGTVRITLDGREAARIPPFEAPKSVQQINVVVDPGPRFTFGRAEVTPENKRADLPAGFKTGEVARATVVRDTAQAAVSGWRAQGYAKASVADQQIKARHQAAQLDVNLRIAPGPKLRFGDVVVTSDSAVRAARIRQIAGIPRGETFDPEELDKAAARLRTTGTFRAVTLTEAEQVSPDGDMDILIEVTDRKPRRFGFGAEVSSTEGVTLSGFWLHRNFFGGAERFRISAEVQQLASTGAKPDYDITARFEKPAVYGADTLFYATAGLSYDDEPDYLDKTFTLGAGVTREFSDTLTGEIGVTFSRSQITDLYLPGTPVRLLSLLSFPTAVTLDRRDTPLSATEGYFLRAELEPFTILNQGESGARYAVDLRGYRAFGADDGVVLAGRMQLAGLIGPDAADAPPRFLLYSGGGGTVRGQPYRSLDVDYSGTRLGGRSFAGLSTELRVDVTKNLGVVGFADAGYVSGSSFPDNSGDWHAGAGLGLRYDTPVGPIRFDVAGPVAGDTGDGVQIYIGIGQAF